MSSVEHWKYLYLLTKARLVQDLEAKALAKGEVFRPTETFVPLVEGVDGQLRIKDTRLVLIARHQEGLSPDLAPVLKALLRGSIQEVLPVRVRDGLTYRVFVSDTVPDQPLPI